MSARLRRVVLLLALLVCGAFGVGGAVGVGATSGTGATGLVWSATSCSFHNPWWACAMGGSMSATFQPQYPSGEVVTLEIQLEYAYQSGDCLQVTVGGLSANPCVSAPGTYAWRFTSPGAAMTIQTQTTAGQGQQITLYESPLPGTSTPVPTNTQAVSAATYTPTATSTPCVVDAWGCDAPATATYVACETGVTVNYGGDPCGPTSTPTPVPTSAGSATATPAPSEWDCGVLRNCDGALGQVSCGHPTFWQAGGCFSGGAALCARPDLGTHITGICYGGNGYADQWAAVPSSAVGKYFCVTFNFQGFSNFDVYFSASSGGGVVAGTQVNAGTSGAGSVCTGAVAVAGQWAALDIQGSSGANGQITSTYFASVNTGATDTPTPVVTPASATPAATWTPRPTATPTVVATSTPLPPGVVPPTSTITANIDACLQGGCAGLVTPVSGVLGGVPGAVGTPFSVDTSPFTPLLHLSTARSACSSFGRAPLLVPHVVGTPVFGSTSPISYTWTELTPVAGVARTIPSTDIQPCADPAIPSFWWDFLYDLSVVATFLVWTLLLMRFVHEQVSAGPPDGGA